ncbi:MAG: branched-chain amino acid ABC transporter ATP-binding protein [Deltaproteobacteria bacterium RBG_16_64_85]|nr:MAG: branched-chain amino acid ABC transporter ATP-binding protein [Deltaproteobacteria bacterium RBG_16_64_85]
MLRIRNVESGYGRLKVLRKVTMHVGTGEIVTIIGANGAGKTTLLRTVSGLLRARSGEILFEMREIGKLPPEKIVFLGCSLVPEGRQLFAPMTVRENILLGAFPQFRRKQGEAVRDDIERIYGIFPLLREREHQLAGTLSGGEQQMLAIARALMARPRLVMMDEPSMGLAPLVMKDIFSIVTRLRDEGNTVLLVEQNARAALGIADRGYVLDTGRIILEGTAENLLSNRDVQRAYLGRDLDAEGRM